MITEEQYQNLEKRVSNLEMALAELIPDEERDRAAEIQEHYRTSKKGLRANG